jgi:hypothetical protein
MATGAACLVARSKLSRYVADLKQSTNVEKAGSLIKTGYLSSVKTAERITGSNIVGGLADMTVRNVVAGLDYTQALVRSAATLGKVEPHEMRNIASTLNLPGFTAGAKSLAEGIGQAMTILKTGINPGILDQRIEGSAFGNSNTHFDNPVLEAVTQGVNRYHSATHQPAYNVAFRVSQYGRARLAGIRAGLKGSALTSYIDGQMANPTEDIFLGAHADAALTAYKNETILSKVASSLRQTVRRGYEKPGQPSLTKAGYGAASIALDMTIPFTRIAGSLANVAVDYSPGGFIKAVASSMEPNPRLQADVATRLAKASLGSGLLMWGMKAAQAGNATGSFPTDAGERKRWDLEGKKPNSVKLGETWHNIEWLGPLSVSFLIGVEIAHAREAEKTGTGNVALQAAGFFGKTMTEMTFLQGISNLVGALQDPAHKMAGVAAQSVPLPAIVPQIAAAVDPYQRAASSVGEKIQSRIPFASRSLPPRLDSFGDTLRATSGAAAVLDVSGSRKATDDAVTRELDRLGVSPGTFGKTLTMDGKKLERSQGEVNSLTSEFGPVKRSLLVELMNEASYALQSDEDKKKELEAALRDVGTTGNNVDRGRRADSRR